VEQCGATVQGFEVNVEVQRLEQQLDSFNARERREALAALWAFVQSGEIVLPQHGCAVNLHSHTFYSYNVHGYSPSKFAWLSRKAGLAVAGIVDFDVLDGSRNPSCPTTSRKTSPTANRR
jgi:hypothetical protein